MGRGGGDFGRYAAYALGRVGGSQQHLVPTEDSEQQISKGGAAHTVHLFIWIIYQTPLFCFAVAP